MSGNNYGDGWAWENSRADGYGYPVDAHLSTRNRGGPNPGDTAPWPVRTPTGHPLAGFKVAVIAAALVTLVGCTLAVLTAAPAAAPAAATTTAPTAPGWPGVFTAPTKTVDPYADTGDWRIGIDLPAGAYRVTVTGEVGGYFALCADQACKVGAGMIANDVLNPGDSTVLDIKATDYMVRTAGVRLVPA